MSGWEVGMGSSYASAVSELKVLMPEVAPGTGKRGGLVCWEVARDESPGALRPAPRRPTSPASVKVASSVRGALTLVRWFGFGRSR